MMANSVYTDTGVRVTDDIGDTVFALLISLNSVAWKFIGQYNNSNMPDTCGSLNQLALFESFISRSVFRCFPLPVALDLLLQLEPGFGHERHEAGWNKRLQAIE